MAFGLLFLVLISRLTVSYSFTELFSSCGRRVSDLFRRKLVTKKQFVPNSVNDQSSLDSSRNVYLQDQLEKLKKNPFFDAERIHRAKSFQGISRPPLTLISTEKSRVRCYVLSDIHADSERNQIWVREHCLRRPEDTESDTFTVMIIPGDVGSDLDRITLVFSHLVTQYDLVCFVPGNHELWRRGTALSPNLSDLSHDATAESSAKSSGGSNRMAPNSIAKMQEILLCAETQGVRIGPVKVNFAEKRNLLLQPLHAWYHSSWDTEPDLTHPDFLAVEEVIPFHRKWGDYSLCSWPPEIIDQRTFVANPTNNTVLAEAFAQLNEEHLHPVPSSSSVSTLRKAAAAVNLSTIFGSPHADPTTTIISFSHYLPRQELCPEKRLLLEPLLSRVVGSDVLEAQIRRLQPHLHLFGHTHVPIDLTLENIVYLQWPLGYHRESTQQCAPIHRHGPLLCFDSLLGDGVDSLPNDRLSLNSGWSKHYRQPGARRPEITDELAPWVQKRLQSFSGLVYSHKERLLRSLEQEKQESDGTNEDRNDQ